MADNVTLDPGAGGSVIATDDDGTAHHQYVKVEFGADGTQTKVSASDPLPVVGTVELGATDNAVLDDIAASVDACETALETAGGLVVNLGANNDVTVTGTVDLGATDNAVLDDIAASVDACETALETAGGLVVNLGANNDVTVTGTVDLGATDNAVLDDIASDTEAMKTSLAVIDNVVFGAGTEAAAQRVTIATDSTGVLGVSNAGLTELAAAINASELDINIASDSVGIGGGTQYAEDTAHTTGDTGTMALGVRFDAGGAIATTDGDYSPFQVDANGALRVTGGGGGTEYTTGDAAAANPVGSAFLMERDDATSAQEAEGDWMNARGTANGALWVAVDGTAAVSNAGLTELAAAINASSQMDVNIAASSGGTVAVSNAGLTELAAAIDTELQVDVVGALPAGNNNIGDVDIATIAAGDNNIGNVDIASIAAGDNNIGNVDVVSQIPGTGATNLGKAIDSVPGATDTGVAALVVRDDALAALTPADADYTTLRVNSTGALWVDRSGTQPVSYATTGSGNATGALRVELANNGTGALTQMGTLSTLTGGGVAHGNADSGNPHKMGARAISANITAESANDRVDALSDLLGYQIVRPYALNQTLWQDTVGPITDTTGVQLMAAGAANVRNYITALTVTNSDATVGTNVIIQDGNGGTTMHEGYAAPAGGGFTVTFPTPLRGSAATAIYVDVETTSSETRVSGSGFQAID